MKTALVIGANGGIGRTICRELLTSSWKVIGLDLDDSPLKGESAEHYIHFKADVTRPRALEEVEMGLQEHVNHLDALVYSAGIFDHFPLAEGDSRRLARIIAVNVTGAANAVKVFSPMLTSGKSRIVLISSETAMASLPFQVYGMTKRMLESYADVLRQENAMLKIPVILIRPGAHETGLLEHSRKALGDLEPESRFSTPMNTVKAQGQKIIDRGSSSPKDVALTVLKALQSPNPRKVYHVNVSLRFYALALMPRRFKEWIVRTLLN